MDTDVFSVVGSVAPMVAAPEVDPATVVPAGLPLAVVPVVLVDEVEVELQPLVTKVF